MATSVAPPSYQDGINQARQVGYSDDEITEHLSATEPKIQTARAAGYSSREILDYLGTPPPSPVSPNAAQINATLQKYGPDLSAPTGGYMGAPSVPFEPEPVIQGTVQNTKNLVKALAPGFRSMPQYGVTGDLPTEQETQAAHAAIQKPLVPLSSGFQPGLVKGVAQGIEGLTSPENAAILAGTMGLSAVPVATAQVASRALGTYFTYQMGKGATDAVKEAYQKHINGDDQGAIQSLGYGSVEAFLAAMGVKHGVDIASDMRGSPTPKSAGPRPEHPDMYPQVQYGVPRLNAPAGEVGAAPPPIEIPKREAPPKPSKTETVSPDTPNPPTAAEPTVPENPATLAAQTEQMTAGKRRVVMYPKGTPAPTSFPQNSAVTSDRFGNTYVFRPDLIARSAIKKAAENNTLNEILGDADMGMGVPDKSAIPPNSPTVVARDAQGTEVHAALTPEENAHTAIEAARRLMPEGGSIGIEPPAQVIGQRMGEFGPQTRFYHGGSLPPDGGKRWLTPDLNYARGYAEKSGPNGSVYYVDIPNNHPDLTKAFEDEGLTTKPPFNSFEASPEISSRLRELGGGGLPTQTLPAAVSPPSGAPAAVPAVPPATAPVSQSPTGQEGGGPVYGSKTIVRVPGEPHNIYPAKFALRELEDVQPSHNGINLEPNPGYPYQNDHDYGAFPREQHITDQPIDWHAARAKTKEVSTPHGYSIALLLNPSAMEVVARTMKYPADSGLTGMYLPLANVKYALAKIQPLAGNAAMRPLIAALQEARLSNKGVAVAKVSDLTRPEEAESTLKEELNHARQDELGVWGNQKHLGEMEAHRFEKLPLAAKAMRNLEIFYGYDLSNRHKAAAEVGVRLMVPNRYRELGLTSDEGRALAAQYVISLRRAYGKAAPAEIAQDIFDALRPSRTPAAGAASPNPVAASTGQRGRGGAATTTGPPVPTDSKGHGAAVEPGRAGKQSGLFGESESTAAARAAARDRNQLTGARLTAQFNSPITGAEQKLRPAGDHPLLDESPIEQRGLFESREPWQQTKLAKLSTEANQVWKRLEEIEERTDRPVNVSEINLPRKVLTKGAQELHRAGLIYGRLYDGESDIRPDLLIPTGNKSHYGGDGQWVDFSRRSEPVRGSSVTLGAGLGALDPMLRESVAEMKAAYDKKQAMEEAMKKAESTPGQKRWGHELLTYITGEKDWWKTRGNQVIEKLNREVPNKTDQEAILLMRDFANKPGELKRWANGAHPNYPTTTEGIRNLKRYEPVIKRALNPSAKMVDANKALTSIAQVSHDELKKLDALDTSISPEEYVPHLLQPKNAEEYPARKNGGLGSTYLGKYFAHGQHRHYETILDALADNSRPQTMNAFDAFSIYNDRVATIRAVALLKKALKKSNIGVAGNGKNTPKDWIPLAAHSNTFKNSVPFTDSEGNPGIARVDWYVPRWVDDVLRPITDPDATKWIKGFVKFAQVNRVAKAGQLLLSLFHAFTENVLSVADVGPKGRYDIARADRFGAEEQAAERHWARRGMKTTVQGHSTEAYKRLAPGSVPKWDEIIKMAPGIKEASKLANLIGDYTFNNLIRKAKILSAESKASSWKVRHPNATDGQIRTAEEAIAKFVNSLYGGLNFENMGISRTMQKLASIVNLAPDWTYSNIAMTYYAAADWKSPDYEEDSSKGWFKRKMGGISPREATAGHLSRMFIMKSIIGAAVATQLLTLALTGKPSKHLFKVTFGHDKEGNEITLNLFLRGSTGDIINWITNMAEYGGVQGTARTFGNKLAAIPRAVLHQINNENSLHQPIAAKGMSPLASTARGVKTALQDLLPIPFSVTNTADLLSEHREPWEYALMLLSGQPPQHRPPEGFHKGTGKREGTVVPNKPKPEGAENSIWDQIRTGQTYKTKKQMRDLASPTPY